MEESDGSVGPGGGTKCVRYDKFPFFRTDDRCPEWCLKIKRMSMGEYLPDVIGPDIHMFISRDPEYMVKQEERVKESWDRYDRLWREGHDDPRENV